MHGRQGKYNALLDYLEALPQAQPSVTLSLDTIVALIDEPLPQRAYSISEFWSGNTARTKWLRSGFQARLHWGSQSVTFTRVAAAQR